MIGYTLWTMFWLGSLALIVFGAFCLERRGALAVVLWLVVTVSMFIGTLLWRLDASDRCGDTTTQAGRVTVVICR